MRQKKGKNASLLDMQDLRLSIQRTHIHAHMHTHRTEVDNFKGGEKGWGGNECQVRAEMCVHVSVCVWGWESLIIKPTIVYNNN